MLTQPEARILILESLQDPGNTGTIIRTAEALGYDAVFYNKGTVDILHRAQNFCIININSTFVIKNSIIS